MNPIAELDRLAAHFPTAEPLFSRVEYIPQSTTPEPYKTLLVHDHHMTVAMEKQHGGPVEVVVHAKKYVGDEYCRKITLVRRGTDEVVQFGLVRFNFAYVTDAVRDAIVAEETPLGRVLINHNVLRHIDLGAILRFEAGPELAELLRMPENGETYGRLATIFCDRRPAVDLLEIAAPLT